MPTYVQQKPNDINVIADKYNTGCDVSAITTIVASAGTYNGVAYGTTATTRRSLDFQFSANNQALGSTILIENTSFPDGLQDLNVSAVTRTITFRNCFFGGRYTTPSGNNVIGIYEDCTFGYFSGSNGTFYNCQFGNDNFAGDGINPYVNIILYDCFIYNITDGTGTVSTHCDAIQIFGITLENTNIHFYRCRMEVPKFPKLDQDAYANACIMLSIEQQNASNISFEDCIINGGGYSIYVAKNEGLTFSNILFKNIQIGHAHQYGDFYKPSTIDPVVDFENITDTNKLYVGSVWKDGSNNVHLSVTNDTLSVKNLIFYTNLGFQFFQIPACFNSADLLAPPITTYYNYSDYPIDLDKNIGTVDYIVAFDGNVTEDSQLRFVNYTETPVEFPDITNSIKATISEMLLRRRQLLVKHTNEPIYTPKLYLRASGTQRVNLGFKPNNNTKITIEATGRVGGTVWIFGARDTSTTKCYGAFINAGLTGGVIRSDFNNIVNSSTANLAWLKRFERFKIVKDGNITTIYDSTDTLIATLSLTDATFESLYDLNLFAMNTTGVYTYAPDLDIHSAIIEKDGNGIVTQNLTPVLDGSNVACLYDSISKTFLYNAGTGDFLYG